MYPFRGTSCVYATKEEFIERSEFDDYEWNVDDDDVSYNNKNETNAIQSVRFDGNNDDEPELQNQIRSVPLDGNNDKEPELQTTQINNVNGLSFLIGNYSDSDDNDDTIPNETINVNEQTILSKEPPTNNLNGNLISSNAINVTDDDEPPVEMKIIRHRDEDDNCTNETVNESRRVHKERKNKKAKLKKNQPIKTNVYNRRRKPTLLEELLREEIRHERNVLLQCVRYVVNKNFFQ